MNSVSTHICSVAQPRILFGRGQSVTSSVADVFLTVESWHEAPVEILVCLFQGSVILWLHYCCGTPSFVINCLLQNERFVMTTHKYEFFDAAFFKFYLFFGFNTFWPRCTSYISWIENNLWLRFVQSEAYKELCELRVSFKQGKITRRIFLPPNSKLWNAVFKITIIYNL